MFPKSSLHSIKFKSANENRVVIIDPKERGRIVAQYRFENDSEAEIIYKYVRQNLPQIIKDGRTKNMVEIESIRSINESMLVNEQAVNSNRIVDNRTMEDVSPIQNNQLFENPNMDGNNFIDDNSNKVVTKSK
ncbi:hypothetical protein TVAG_101320 [Trichomonas vaginalis G3]|uniref:Uncharacterized protein n=1 Tax=Trichomonas vaginalis (strain ATCC PRA-98 / G3) TaxID=412133 RepID=A2DJL4_TRIV3|nr:hypothetical protein TVAGG3_1035820 [Trichomonas vaginalis G3]EAY19414.1 hypothetical protein TVAG_101320 [Trichomonas vaginalis G3]KAI5493188.1 hypothetical protein TVAGG3_1035820 [Trichomonas vaginalis G3]|eukprot:XP_001580400.1 hypothetical protein [Trichomonas vaginalis G3]